MTDSSSRTNTSYVQANLSPSVVQKLEAGAFRSLCEHLRDRSEQVQNIDLMSVGGFCRNCLAKWMVIEARQLSLEDFGQTREALDALGYDEAAEHVYGCTYNTWKERYAKKATDEQMRKYNASAPIHSVFKKELLAKKSEKVSLTLQDQGRPSSSKLEGSKSLLSNVCCQDVDDQNLPNKTHPPVSTIPEDYPQVRASPSYLSPNAPSGGITFSLTVVTVSDRAFRKEYETGDLSGPAVQRAVQECVSKLNTSNTPVICKLQEIVVIPDELEVIQSKLREYASANVDLVITTGGTGFATRDVTPEATQAVLEWQCHGLMSFVTTECSKAQPLASLSRGIAGVLGKTMICNLPGNPQGIREIIPILLPLVIHAIHDLQR